MSVLQDNNKNKIKLNQKLRALTILYYKLPFLRQVKQVSLQATHSVKDITSQRRHRETIAVCPCTLYNRASHHLYSNIRKHIPGWMIRTKTPGYINGHPSTSILRYGQPFQASGSSLTQRATTGDGRRFSTTDMSSVFAVNVWNKSNIIFINRIVVCKKLYP